MSRSTVYNTITSDESIKNILPENRDLTMDFLDYLKSIDRAQTTINAYHHDLNIFFVWNEENNRNKRFTEITKREFARFQSFALNEWGWSPKRIRRVKSTISSLSNYIENILDEEPEYEGYRSSIRKIESPVNDVVREKTVFSAEEVENMLNTLVDRGEYKCACVVALAAYSGRRKAELVRFKRHYFSDENVIFGSLYRTPEKVVTKGRGKGKLLTLYTLKPKFDPYLKLWLKELDKNGIESEWLFPDANDPTKQMSTSIIDSWYDKLTEITGKPFYMHSLRHYLCSELVRQGLPMDVIQELFGWADLSLVNIYNDNKAEDTFGKYFGEDGIKPQKKKD